MADWYQGYSDAEGDSASQVADEEGCASVIEDIDRSQFPKKIMKTTSLHLQFFCVIIMRVGCHIRELSNREMNSGQRAIKMFRNVEQGLRDRTAFPLPDGVAASQMLKQSYFNLTNGGEAAFTKFCVGMVPEKELTKDMIHHGDSLYTNKFLETRCKIRLTAQPKFKEILESLQPNGRSGISADVSQYLQKANEELHKFLFHQHALEPTIDNVSKLPKHYRDQEYNPSWQQNWWLFWCTECSPSGKKSASATMEALEESSGPSMDSQRSDSHSNVTPDSVTKSTPTFPISEKQKSYLSRKDIEKRNKLQRTINTEGVCDHFWLPHPCALNGVPAVFCRKCTVMKACIIQESPSPACDQPTPSSSNSMGNSVAVPDQSDSNGSSVSTTSVTKELFPPTNSNDTQTNQSVTVSEHECFDAYYKALTSLSKTVWNVNIERKDTHSLRGKGIFAKTLIPRNQVVALYRGVPNT